MINDSKYYKVLQITLPDGYDIIFPRYRLAEVRNPLRRSVGAVIFLEERWIINCM
jgi:hypothetical protein